MIKIVLASGSPRRKELLKLIVPNFEVIVSGADETLNNNFSLEERVSELAYLKAKRVFDTLNGEKIVIGADTIVVKNDKIYGKPKDKIDAKEMLKKLLDGDKSHDVITGLSVIIGKNGEYKEIKTYDKTKVYFTDISERELDNWIDSGKAMDKAGGYGIQTEFGVFIDRIEGNYTTIVGLPIHKLYKILSSYK